MKRLFHPSFSSRLVHPKSPDVEALLSSGFEVKGGQGEKQEKSLSLQFGDFSAVTPCTVVKTPELEAYLEVPWEVPKLRKKLQSRKKIPAQDFMQGSDSGISMSSQETRDVAPWLQAPKLRRRHELEGGGSTSQAVLQQEQGRAGSGTKKEGESRRSLCLTQPSSNSSVAANAEFLVQSYPGPRPASMVSASLGLECRSAAEGGGEGAAEAVKVKGEKEREEEEEGNGESFQQPPPAVDISDLPFSMPKLARRLGQAPPSSPPLKLLRQPAAFSQSLSLNIAAPPPESGACSSQPCSPTFPKPLRSRPMSLLQPSSQPGPQLNLTLQSRPGEERKTSARHNLTFSQQGLLPLAGSESFGRPASALDPPSLDLLQSASAPFGGSAPASAVPTRKKPLLFLAPSRCPSTICFIQSTAAEREKPGFG